MTAWEMFGVACMVVPPAVFVWAGRRWGFGATVGVVLIVFCVAAFAFAVGSFGALAGFVISRPFGSALVTFVGCGVGALSAVGLAVLAFVGLMNDVDEAAMRDRLDYREQQERKP